MTAKLLAGPGVALKVTGVVPDASLLNARAVAEFGFSRTRGGALAEHVIRTGTSRAMIHVRSPDLIAVALELEIHARFTDLGGEMAGSAGMFKQSSPRGGRTGHRTYAVSVWKKD